MTKNQNDKALEEKMKKFPAENRYEAMVYNRCGRSGLKLPAISLGLWHNFGGVDVFENAQAMVHRAFDLGITHFIWLIIMARRTDQPK